MMDRRKELLYNCLLLPAGLLAMPVFLARAGKYRKGAKQKLGRLPAGLFSAKKGKRIWVNAVSVGEVMGASAVIKEIRKEIPGADIVVSTGTDTGQETARKIIGSDASALFYCPLDLPPAVRSVIDRVNPDLFISSESEIWPNLLIHLKDKGVKTLLVNGRISAKSFRRYSRARFFWQEVFGLFDRICAVSEEESAKMLKLGVAPEKLSVAGNTKFDVLAGSLSAGYAESMKDALCIKANEQIFIAASLHPGEFGIIADAFTELLKMFPHLVLIAAPRHPERAGALARVFSMRKMDSYLRSERGLGKERAGEKVIIVDTIGELFKVYGIGSVVFCGGSLVPRGGQNILEPAVWGKVVLHGPYMEDFEQEKRILEDAGSGHTVRSAVELVELAGRMLANPLERDAAGIKGRDAVIAAAGAARTCARTAAELLGKNGGARNGD